MTDPTQEAANSPTAGDTDTESLYGAPPEGSEDYPAVEESDTDIDPADGGPGDGAQSQ